jgi:hypothetical protein
MKEKGSAKGGKVEGVGVMKDNELKLIEPLTH